MSAANAAAIRRRVNNQNPQPANTNNSNTNNSQSNQKTVSLPQIINGLDKRIKQLETNLPDSNNINSVFSNDILDEFNSRFEILANELSEMKDIIMKLQSFTMEVNKSLYDERIQIFSDVDTNNITEDILDLDTNTNENDENNIEAIVQDESIKESIREDIQTKQLQPNTNNNADKTSELLEQPGITNINSD